jgi:tripartite motif-containing protein 71
LDNVYVIDDTGRIQKFTDDGTFITSWGSDGNGDGQFSKPEGLYVDPDGNVYVADTVNKRIQVFSLSDATITPNK